MSSNQTIFFLIFKIPNVPPLPSSPIPALLFLSLEDIHTFTKSRLKKGAQNHDKR